MNLKHFLSLEIARMQYVLRLIPMLCLFPTGAFAQSPSVGEEYEKLLAEFDGNYSTFAPRLLEFAEQNIEDDTAMEALFWIVDYVRGRREAVKSIELLQKHFVTSDAFEPYCESLSRARTVNAESLLRNLIKKNPTHEIKAHAAFYLAKLLDREANSVEELRANPEIAPRVLQYYGKDYGAHLASLTPENLAKKQEAAYEILLESFADVKVDGEKIGPLAEFALQGIRNLSVGKIAPEIDGPDINGDRFKLSDYRGKVVMLSFWGHW